MKPDQLSLEQFNKIAEIAKHEAGLFIDPSKLTMVSSRLTKRLRDLRIFSIDDYLRILSSKSCHTEISNFISCMTTNTTYFFREPHHFDFFSRIVLPDLEKRSAQGHELRIWSAGCSEGMEAYSISLCVQKSHIGNDHGTVRILGTDINRKMISRARLGQYPSSILERVPSEYKEYCIQDSEDSQTIKLSNEVRKRCRFNELNLNGQWPFLKKFDVIFCRNVVIYFDEETQHNLWSRFSSALSEGGFLFIGHSERISGPSLSSFKSHGMNIFQRVTNANH